MKSYFLIIKVSDFGTAFGAMLEWEGNMEKELSFLGARATTTDGIFSWRDIIIKNKDTRALANSLEKAKMAYTFLDKNTILIVGDLSPISTLSSAYASRAVVR